MAQAIKTGNVTPADELRELLTLNEKRVSNLRNSGAGALDLLLDMDRISDLLSDLEPQGVDLRAELGRWETLRAVLRRHDADLVQEMRAIGGLSAARAQHRSAVQPEWWWMLDEQVRKKRRRRVARVGAILASAALVVGLLYFLVFRVLFPENRSALAAFDAQHAGETKIAADGDYVGALADFRRAAELQPDNAQMWLQVGCTLLKLGDSTGAEESFNRARPLLGDDNALRQARAPVCLAMGLPDYAEADLQAVIAADPESAMAYYYLASIFEQRGEAAQAIAALQRASELAEASQDAQLQVMARYRIAILTQQLVGQSLVAPTPTP